MERLIKRAVLLSGAGAALVACTAAQPGIPYPDYGSAYPYYGTSYPYYGAYGGYYAYPRAYYYGDPWFDPWVGRPLHHHGFSGGHPRTTTHQPPATPAPAAPKPSSGGAPSGGGAQPKGFLGNVLRQTK